jgi:hypothetical protein
MEPGSWLQKAPNIFNYNLTIFKKVIKTKPKNSFSQIYQEIFLGSGIPTLLYPAST